MGFGKYVIQTQDIEINQDYAISHGISIARTVGGSLEMSAKGFE